MKRIAAFLLVAGMVSGCALMPGENAKPSDRRFAAWTLPPRATVENVPVLAKADEDCGPASLATALGWSGTAADPADLRLSDIKSGAAPGSLFAASASRYGMLAYPIQGLKPLLQEVAAGRPVIAMQNLGVVEKPKWQCVVVVGYDLPAGEILLQGDSKSPRPIPLRVFEHLWQASDNWGLLVLPAGEMPHAADVKRYLDAAKALAVNGPGIETVLAYDAAIATWPENAEAHMGQAAALTAMGDRKGASQAWREAAELAENPALPLVNLAELLVRMGQLEEAREVAQKAALHAGYGKSLSHSPD